MNTFQDSGEKLLKEAQKKVLTSQSFFWSLFGGTAKLEEAAECYVKAGNFFRMDRNWEKSGFSLFQAAELYRKLKMMNEAGGLFMESATAFKKIDVPKSVDVFTKAIEVYEECGRFLLAAKLHQTIGEVYEIENENMALRHFEKAADYYKSEGDVRASDRCNLKVANFASKNEDFEKAIGIYEDLARNTLKLQGYQFLAIEYLCKSLLCYLASDFCTTPVVLENYCKDFPIFRATREEFFVKSLIETYENEVQFTGVVDEYSSVSRLDSWFIMILSTIIKKFNKRIE